MIGRAEGRSLYHAVLWISCAFAAVSIQAPTAYASRSRVVCSIEDRSTTPSAEQLCDSVHQHCEVVAQRLGIMALRSYSTGDVDVMVVNAAGNVANVISVAQGDDHRLSMQASAAGDEVMVRLEVDTYLRSETGSTYLRRWIGASSCDVEEAGACSPFYMTSVVECVPGPASVGQVPRCVQIRRRLVASRRTTSHGVVVSLRGDMQLLAYAVIGDDSVDYRQCRPTRASSSTSG